MTTPASNTPTSSGQGGTGGGTQPPANNKDTEAAQGGTRTEPTAPAATQPDTTRGGPLGGAGATGDTDSHANDPKTTPPDTTAGGGGIGGTANPAYRAPANFPPASNLDTSGRAGVLTVDPSSPDAPVVGNASGINPNAVDPGYTANGYPAPNSSYAISGTRDTGSTGSPPIATVPSAGNPLAPTSVTASVITGRSAVHVAWTAPTNAVAAGVLGYVIENNKTGTMRVGKNVTTAEFEQGLVPGDAYTFTVYALTANGSGPRSAASAPVTVPKAQNLLPDTEADYGVQGTRQGLPAAPAAPVGSIASATSVSVAFAAPANGGSAITEYTVTSTPGNKTAVGSASPLVVTGLTTSTAYTFKVKAKNVYGYGAQSPASNSVTPA